MLTAISLIWVWAGPTIALAVQTVIFWYVWFPYSVPTVTDSHRTGSVTASSMTMSS